MIPFSRSMKTKKPKIIEKTKQREHIKQSIFVINEASMLKTMLSCIITPHS
jgi:hypothetical protein